MIYLLSGSIGTGKSTALLKWSQGRNDVFGILTPKNKNGIRFILDVNTKECFEMETHSETADVIFVGRYHFLKTAFETGNAIIKRTLKNTKSGYVIIDELGKLELESKGFHESASLAITETINNNHLHLLLIIRSSLLIKMIEKFRISDYQLIAISELNQSLNFRQEIKNNNLGVELLEQK